MKETALHIETDQRELVIRTGEAEKLHRYRGLEYWTHTAEDFVSLVEARGSAVETIVLLDRDEAKAILDDTVDDREQDVVHYPFELSPAAKEWGDALTDPDGRAFDVKELAAFLKRRPSGEVNEQEALLHAVQNFRYVTNTEGDFTFEDRNNYTFAIKVKDAEGTVKVPKVLTVRLALLEGHEELDDLEVEVETFRPSAPGSKPGFLLSCPKFARYWREAVARERENIAQALPCFTVIRGSGGARP